MDKVYLAVYSGAGSEVPIRESVTNLKDGGGFRAILVDRTFDGGCAELKGALSVLGIDAVVKPGDETGLEGMVDELCRILMEEEIRRIEGGRDDAFEAYLEIGGMDGIQSGAVFAAAMRCGASVTYHDADAGRQSGLSFKPLPNVDRIGYHMSKMLDILYRGDAQDYASLRDKAYADSIVNLAPSEREGFFKTHHNAYKTLEKLVDRGWARRNPDKTYEITPEGNTARVMIDLRNLKSGR